MNVKGRIIVQRKIKALFKSQPVMCIAFLLAAATMLIVTPDKQYAGYINRAVLIQLFSLMLAVSGLRSAGIFEKMTAFLMKKAGNSRRLSLMFVLLCFFTSMLVTNDVALLTFVPLSLIALSKMQSDKATILTVVLETVAANMGSMLTPIGNPQNLFLYDEFNLSAAEFLKTLLPSGSVSLAILILLTFLIPKESFSSDETKTAQINRLWAVCYSVLFAVCILSVVRVVPDIALLAVVLATALIVNRKILLKVDYPLLFTFVCFFVFVGNVSRIDAVRDAVNGLLQGREVIVSALLSQVISNVPASVMLAGFTENGRALLLGVNLGGLGTMIASLASLISFQFYRKQENAKSGKYMLCFSAINFSMLALLLILEQCFNMTA